MSHDCVPPVPHGCVKAWLRRSSASFRGTRRAERTQCNCADRTQRRGGSPVSDGGNGRAERSQAGAPNERNPCRTGDGRLAALGTAGSGDPRRTERGRVGRPGGRRSPAGFSRMVEARRSEFPGDDPPARVTCHHPAKVKRILDCRIWSGGRHESWWKICTVAGSCLGRP